MEQPAPLGWNAASVKDKICATVWSGKEERGESFSEANTCTTEVLRYVAPLQESWLPGQPIQPHYLRTRLANRGELSTYFLNVHDLIPRYSITRASLEHDPYCQIFYRRTL